MATRPVFFVDSGHGVIPKTKEIQIDFDWHPGFSIAQKQRSIRSLHSRILATTTLQNPLEISSKSPLALGVDLSAFNLQLRIRSSLPIKASVETVYQGSKQFNGVPRFDSDRYHLEPRDARKRARDFEDTAKLSGWTMGDFFFDLSSGTEFYSWLYLGALYQQESLLKQLVEYDCFTDIEFNPKKSFACQARSAALARAIYLNEGSLLPYLKRISKSRIVPDVVARNLEGADEGQGENKRSQLELDL
jgi:hypothetical protein